MIFQTHTAIWSKLDSTSKKWTWHKRAHRETVIFVPSSSTDEHLWGVSTYSFSIAHDMMLGHGEFTQRMRIQ